jgi:cell division protein FtsW
VSVLSLVRRRPVGGTAVLQPLAPPRERRTAAAATQAVAGAETWEARALVGLTLVAFCFGVLEMYSASAFLARTEGLPAHFFAVKQLKAAALGVVIAALLSRVDYRRFRLWAWPMLIGVVVLLIVVILPGTESIAPRINGARRWINLGMSFQPSEVAKIAVMLWTAALVVKKADKLHSLRKGLVPFLVVWLPVAFLVLMEPNMSAALLIVLLASLVLFAGGARIGHFIFFGMLAFPVIWHQISHAGYRAQRIAAFLDPTGHHQIHQSLIAIGSGGLRGVGIGASRQKYGFLPEPHNDFLFAMIAEEWGLFGILLVVAIFAAFLWVGYRIAARAPDRFGYLVAIGMTNMIAVSAFMHMGVALSLLPTTGVALPFMSYGGSALLGYFAAVGILLSVARAAKAGPA